MKPRASARTFQLTTHRVVAQSLIGRELAAPWRRLTAFGIDVALLAVPTILVAVASAALALRISDRPAYDAARTLISGDVHSDAQSVDTMAALLPRLVAIGAEGLPAEAIAEAKAGRVREAAALVKDYDVDFSLTFTGDDNKPLRPGRIRVNIAKFVPSLVQGAALFGVPALYFTLLGTTRGGTIGKRLLGIEACRLDLRRQTIMESFDRFAGYAQVPGTLFIGLADLWREPNRRLAHDRLANTVVLRKGKS